jgi:hypothetical protein
MSYIVDVDIGGESMRHTVFFDGENVSSECVRREAR